jgi:hypothetical protein
MSLNPANHKNEETAARQDGGDSSSNMPSLCSIEGSCQGSGLASARQPTANAVQLRQAPRIPLLQLNGPDTIASFLREIRRRRPAMAQCDRHRLKALQLPLRTIDEHSQFELPPLRSFTGRSALEPAGLGGPTFPCLSQSDANSSPRWVAFPVAKSPSSGSHSPRSSIIPPESDLFPNVAANASMSRIDATLKTEMPTRSLLLKPSRPVRRYSND